MTTSRTTTQPAGTIHGGDTVVLQGRYFEVYRATRRGAKVTIYLDGGRWGDRKLTVDADQRVTIAA